MLYLTLRQYHYIVAVADATSLTNAALALHVSQPSVSVAITRVEDRLGCRIFNRGKGATITLTPFGHRFVARIRDLLCEAQAIENSAAAIRPFVLGCFEDIAPWYLPKALKALRDQFPDMQFEGREGRFSSLAADIIEGRVDLAISYDVGFEGGFLRQKIKDTAPVAFMAPTHPLAEFPSVELHQLARHRLILSGEELSLGYVKQLFDRMNMQPDVAHTTTSLEMMRSLAAHGAGVGISYSNPPTAYSYDGQPLVTIPIETPEALASIVMVWTNHAEPSPVIKPILETIRAV